MINKKLLASIFLSILLTFNAFAAGSSDSGSSKTKTQYDMAVSHINAAKKIGIITHHLKDNEDLITILTDKFQLKPH